MGVAALHDKLEEGPTITDQAATLDNLEEDANIGSTAAADDEVLSSPTSSKSEVAPVVTNKSMVDVDLDEVTKGAAGGQNWSDSKRGALFQTAGDGGPNDLAGQINAMGQQIDGVIYNGEWQRKYAKWCIGHGLHAKVWMAYMKELMRDFHDQPTFLTADQWVKWILGNEVYTTTLKFTPRSFKADTTWQTNGGFLRFSDYRKVVNLLNNNGFKATFANSHKGGSYATALDIMSKCIDPQDFIPIFKSYLNTQGFDYAIRSAMNDLKDGGNSKCYASASELNCKYASWGCESTEWKPIQHEEPPIQDEKPIQPVGPVKPAGMMDATWNGMSHNCRKVLDGCEKYAYCHNVPNQCPGKTTCQCNSRSEARPRTNAGMLVLMAALVASFRTDPFNLGDFAL